MYKRCISFTNLASGIKKWRFVYRYAVFNLQTSFLPYKLASRITTQLSNEYRITLKGTLSHTVTLGADVFGNITRLNNALENLAGNLDEERAKLEEAKVQLENARTELATPFACKDELTEKTARLKELNILLNMDEKDKMLIDEAPDEGEEPPVRKVVGLER